MDSFRNFLAAHPLGSIAVAIAAQTLVYFLHIPDDSENRIANNKKLTKVDWELEYVDIRFGTLQDSAGMNSVYNEWFTDDVSMDESEYDKIVERGIFIRLAEAFRRNGEGKQTKVVGYYSIFAISIETYDKLRKGKMREQDLKSADILDFSDKAAEVLYVPEICEEKNFKIGQLLFRDLIRYTFFILETNTNIKIIAAWPYTKYGKQFIETLKMKKAPGRIFFQKVFFMTRTSALGNPKPSGIFKQKRRINF